MKIYKGRDLLIKRLAREVVEQDKKIKYEDASRRVAFALFKMGVKDEDISQDGQLLNPKNITERVH